MASKHNQIRVLGQRSILSSFTFGSSNLAKGSNDDAQKKGVNMDSSISLSDFLTQKLHTTPAQPKVVKGKSRPFKSPLGSRDDGGSLGQWNGIGKEEKEVKSVIDQVVFKQFKHAGMEKGDGIGSCGGGTADGEIGTSSASLGIDSPHVGQIGEIGTSYPNNEQETRKSRVHFAGDDNHSIWKRPLVLGDDTQPKHKLKRKRFISNQKQRPLYNHYANGCGWWDCDMEGVDSEEVGFGEVWEGVGSTTLGGIEWH